MTTHDERAALAGKLADEFMATARLPARPEGVLLIRFELWPIEQPREVHFEVRWPGEGPDEHITVVCKREWSRMAALLGQSSQPVSLLDLRFRMCNPITTIHPDVLISKGVHEGFEWEVTGNRMGYRCGYVRVPAGHPWHGKDYDAVDASVHGGLTFADSDTDCGKGGEDNAWWLGFDCAHAGDAPDPALPGYRPEMEFPGDTVKTTPYAEAECRSLAEQAKVAA